MFTPPKLLTCGEEKAAKGGTLSNAFGKEKGNSQISYFFTFGALVHIHFISVVWRKEGSGYVEVGAVKLWELMLILWASQESLPCT